MIRAEVLFSSDLWERALEKFATDTRLSVKLFDASEQVVFGPIHPTPIFQLFEETGYDPGIFAECARRCVQQTDSRPPVMVSEFCGLTVIGTSLVLEGKVVGAAVGGYAFVDFSQLSEVQRLARDGGIRFEQLWQVAREQRPVPKNRLMLNGELLQVLGDALLRENYRTRQYEEAVVKLQETAKAKEEAHRKLQATAAALHESERLLRIKDEQLRLAQKAARVGSWELDVEQGELRISQEFAEIVGLPSHVSSLRQAEFLDMLFFSGDREKAEEDLRKAVRKNKEFSTELRLKRGNGICVVSSRGKAFYNQGSPLVLGVLVDVTPDEVEEPKPKKTPGKRAVGKKSKKTAA